MWKIVKLGDLCEFVRGPFGGSLKKNIFVSNGYAVYEQQHAINNQCADFRYFITEDKFKEMQRFVVKPNDILMSCSGTIGKTTIVPSDAPLGIINQALLKITASEEVDTLFLKLFMQSSHFNGQLMNTVDGAAIQNVASVKILKQILISLPPLAEQERIVAKLDAAFAEIDRAIEVANAKETEVQKLKASLLGLSLGGNAMMSEIVKLGDLFKIGSSKRVLKAEWKDSGVPFYRGREITTLSKTGNVDNDLFISEEHFSQLKSKYGVPQEGDLVVTAIGTIGNTYIVREQDRFYFKDASVLWLQKISDVHSRFVDYWFKSSSFFEQLEVGNGATVDTLSISKLNVMDFPLPPLAEQQRIVAKLDAAFAEIENANNSIIKSKANYLALKSALLAQELRSEAA